MKKRSGVPSCNERQQMLLPSRGSAHLEAETQATAVAVWSGRWLRVSG